VESRLAVGDVGIIGCAGGQEQGVRGGARKLVGSLPAHLPEIKENVIHRVCNGRRRVNKKIVKAKGPQQIGLLSLRTLLQQVLDAAIECVKENARLQRYVAGGDVKYVRHGLLAGRRGGARCMRLV
jgi:hypothetical protein